MPDMTPNDPEWAAAWGWFADPVMEDDATGETLQYMGSEHNGSTYTHVFRHRALPGSGQRYYWQIPASKAWQPRVPETQSHEES